MERTLETIFWWNLAYENDENDKNENQNIFLTKIFWYQRGHNNYHNLIFHILYWVESPPQCLPINNNNLLDLMMLILLIVSLTLLSLLEELTSITLQKRKHSSSLFTQLLLRGSVQENLFFTGLWAEIYLPTSLPSSYGTLFTWFVS